MSDESMTTSFGRIPMKICMVSYSQYEFDNRVHRYAKSRIDRGDRVDVVCLGAEGQPKEEMWNGARLYRIQTRDYNEKNPLDYMVRMAMFFLRSSVVCTRLHFRNRYHVFHFHNIPDFGVFCTLIPRMTGAKVIHDVHDLVPEFYQRKFGLGPDHAVVRFLKILERMSCRFADHVITVTTIWKNTLVGRSVSERKCSVVLNSPDQELFFPGPPVRKDPSEPFRLVYHGNLTEIFGVDLAVRAMERVHKQCPDITLSVYGQGRTVEDLRSLEKDLGVQSIVHFNDPIPRYKIAEMLRQVDAGIDPKRDGVLAGEGLSSKCMEYLATGLPAVVSEIKAARTYYDDSMVLFFRPGDHEDLARKIIRLRQDHDLRRRLSRNAVRFGRTHGWPVYESVYNNVLMALTASGGRA
jgi:glycosyltransferase involved in cell wall biosynthesis